MIFQIISIVCNLIALILLIICYKLHKDFLKESIHREELLIFLNVVQQKLKDEGEKTRIRIINEEGLDESIYYGYFVDGEEQAINYIKSIIKDKTKLNDYIKHYLERKKSK